jgi:Domain of unknown function (DUF4412)
MAGLLLWQRASESRVLPIAAVVRRVSGVMNPLDGVSWLLGNSQSVRLNGGRELDAVHYATRCSVAVASGQRQVHSAAFIAGCHSGRTATPRGRWRYVNTHRGWARIFEDAMTRWALHHTGRLTAAMVLCCSLYTVRMPAQTPGGGTITYQMDVPQGGLAILRYSVRGGSMRIDMFNDTTQGANEMSQVFDVRRGTWVILMPRMKAYMQMPTGIGSAAPHPIASDTSHVGGSRSSSGQFTPTGGDETVAGIICNDYVGRSQEGIYELCAARGMNDFIPTVLPPRMGAMARDSGALEGPLAALVGRHVFPLKLVTRRNGTVSTIVATHVSRDLPDSSLFVIPADYRPIFTPQSPQPPR